jgi:hypothetical protein
VQTSWLATLELGQDEVKRGRFQDIDQFLAEFEKEDDCLGETSKT